MQFSSDNWAGAAAEITASLSANATGFSPAYGQAEIDRRLELRFNELFEREVAVFFVGTGTAANALALTALNRPGGFVLCHRESHLIEDECGAPEFFTCGARLSPIDGPCGKMDPGELKRGLERFDPSFVHHGQPMAVSLTQATEVGSVYTLQELALLADITHRQGLSLHMDGARFANALVQLDVSPAEMTWRSGVDVLSFGATKNGCWCAEALVFFHPKQAEQLPFIRKRAAQLFSKTRFIAAQFHAYLDDNLWLRLARSANDQASVLAAGIEASENAVLAWPSQSNEVFAFMNSETVARLQASGAQFYSWPIPFSEKSNAPAGTTLQRFVTSFATTETMVTQFLNVLG
ncbi:MAG: low specificity L-threonine aldolase [Planctomycetota bacterium]